MGEKKCKDCHKVKSFDEFHKSKNFKDGFRNMCKDCRKLESIKNREETAKRNKLYYENNKKVISDKSKEYRNTHKEEIFEQRKQYRSRNKEHIQQKAKDYSETRNKNTRERRKVDIEFRIKEACKSKFHRAMKRGNNNFNNIISCTTGFLKKWIEFNFDDKMNWENYGDTWHIDHVYPINQFNMSNELEKRICFNWKNLRPLNGKENISKSDDIKIDYILNHYKDVVTYISNNNIIMNEYQNLEETLDWLREKLRYGNKLERWRRCLKWAIRSQVLKMMYYHPCMQFNDLTVLGLQKMKA